MVSLTFPQMIDYLTNDFLIPDIPIQKRVVPFMHGEPGIGKSALMALVAKKMGWKLIDIRASLLADSSDITGIPFPLHRLTAEAQILGAIALAATKNNMELTKQVTAILNSQDSGRVTYLLPEFLPKQDEKQPYLIFFDEVNRARPDIVQALFQFLYDKRIGSYELPNHHMLTAAGNFGDKDKTNTITFDSAWNNRFWHAELQWQVKDVLKYYRSQGYADHAIAFLEAHGDTQLQNLPQEENEYAWRSLRSWEGMMIHAGKYMAGEHVDVVRAENIALGFVGPDGAGQLRDYLSTLVLISPADIVDKYKTSKDKLKKLDEKMLLAVNAELEEFLLRKEDFCTTNQVKNVILYASDFLTSEKKRALLSNLVKKAKSFRTPALKCSDKIQAKNKSSDEVTMAVKDFAIDYM